MADLTQEYLKSRLRYEPESGHFYWVGVNKYHPRLTGQLAGWVNNNGYVYISIDSYQYRAHRLAWLYMLGDIPAEIDHINRDKSDNKWTNLRQCSHSQNAQNHGRTVNKSGLPVGVSRERSGRFGVQIRRDGVIHCLGTFDTPAEASAAYQAKRKKLFGEFA